MKKLLLLFGIIPVYTFGQTDKPIGNLTAVSTVNAADVYVVEQSDSTRKITYAMLQDSLLNALETEVDVDSATAAAHIASTNDPHSVRLDQLGNPTGNFTIAMGNYIWTIAASNDTAIYLAGTLQMNGNIEFGTNSAEEYIAGSGADTLVLGAGGGVNMTLTPNFNKAYKSLIPAYNHSRQLGNQAYYWRSLTVDTVYFMDSSAKIYHDTANNDLYFIDGNNSAQALADLIGGGGGSTQEEVQDYVGTMVTGNTETRITVTYNDVNNTFDFVVDDMNDDQPDNDGEVPDAITVNPVNATTEAAIEAVVDLQDLQGSLTFDRLSGPLTNTSLTLANKTITWNFTNPAGGMAFNYIGAASGHLFDVSQNTGNPGAGTHLMHFEATDTDVSGIHVDVAGDTAIHTAQNIYAGNFYGTVPGYFAIADTGTAFNAFQEKDAQLTDLADGTLTGDFVNTAYPWADDEVANNITASNYTLLSDTAAMLDPYLTELAAASTYEPLSDSAWTSITLGGTTLDATDAANIEALGTDTVSTPYSLFVFAFTDSAQMVDERTYFTFWNAGPDSIDIDSTVAFSLSASPNFQFNIQFSQTNDASGAWTDVFTVAPTVNGADATSTGEVDTPNNNAIPPRRWIRLIIKDTTDNPLYGATITVCGKYY